MLPYLIAAVGGYLIGDSQDDKKFVAGGVIERGDIEVETITKTMELISYIEGLPEKVYYSPMNGTRFQPTLNVTFDININLYDGIRDITIHTKRIFGTVQTSAGEVIKIDIKNEKDGEWEFPEDINFGSYLEMHPQLYFQDKVVKIK
jgi:hypothetical protein